MKNLVNFRQEYGRYSRYFQEIKKVYTEREEVRDSIELLLTLLAISFFVIFAIRPTANTIAQLLSSINTQQEISNQLDEKIKSLSLAQSMFVQKQNDLANLEEGLTEGPFPEKYLRQIEGLAASTNVELSTLSFNDVVLIGKTETIQNTNENKNRVQGTKDLRITFSASGDYQATYSFLERLEALRLPIKVDSFSFGPANNSGSGFSLNLAGYFLYFEEKD